jgi:hypothetical protein
MYLFPRYFVADTAFLDQEDEIRDQKNQAIVTWLSPNLNFGIPQCDFFRQRHDSTYTWFLNDPKFKGWLNGTNRLLWCPGMRKSQLSISRHADFV